MRKITKGVAFATTALFAMFIASAASAVPTVTARYAGSRVAAGGGPPTPEVRQSVSLEQYRILKRQCEYAETAGRRQECRAEVVRRYVIGEAATNLDCRTYSGVTVCGTLALSPRQQRCVDQSVAGGLTYRRAEVECYAFS
ncbi:hypothetical protein DQ384_02960 [Sphaerisporangium album]|uniref:Subtilisin inhibitor domain-containing protein n=1 Tax=Sphaerisporangium album TaxID=509200 RepID=A0A367FS11_9ACTN|nr:hypothetical protein [Sphaerisporangium album]RCG32480.1 hypothetical protein DQ384_02960 [Sphaerisporangium album]